MPSKLNANLIARILELAPEPPTGGTRAQLVFQLAEEFNVTTRCVQAYLVRLHGPARGHREKLSAPSPGTLVREDVVAGTLPWYDRPIRSVRRGNEYLLVLSDVLDALEMDPSSARDSLEVRSRDRGEVGAPLLVTLRTNGGLQDFRAVSEGEVIHLTYASRSKKAVKFRIWVEEQIHNLLSGKPVRPPTEEESPTGMVPAPAQTPVADLGEYIRTLVVVASNIAQATQVTIQNVEALRSRQDELSSQVTSLAAAIVPKELPSASRLTTREHLDSSCRDYLRHQIESVFFAAYPPWAYPDREAIGAQFTALFSRMKREMDLYEAAGEDAWLRATAEQCLRGAKYLRFFSVLKETPAVRHLPHAIETAINLYRAEKPAKKTTA